nr:hypothetical protein [Mycobacterium genavense]
MADNDCVRHEREYFGEHIFDARCTHQIAITDVVDGDGVSARARIVYQRRELMDCFPICGELDQADLNNPVSV